MRWVKLWAVLAGVYLAARLVIGWAIPGSAELGGAFAARLAVVPILQAAAAGAVLSFLRRSRRS